MWGNKGGYPTICLHGYNDNAASFDRLLPHLASRSRCFFAVDLPGHGKSNHYPLNSQVSYLDYLADLKRICEYFSWTQVDIIAHSLRSQLSLYFASIFPKLVQKLVLIDLVAGEVLFEYSHIYDVTVHEVNSMIRPIESSTNNHLYSEELALKKFLEGRIATIKDEFAIPLFKRSISTCNDKVYFSNDKRNMKFMTPLIPSQFHLALVSKVQCPVLIIMSTMSEVYVEKAKTSYVTLKLLQTSLGKHLKIKQTNFSHDMHIENSGEVAYIIGNYLIGTSSKL
nr:serine hydrolase-like protein [Halyomorpha halys]